MLRWPVFKRKRSYGLAFAGLLVVVCGALMMASTPTVQATQMAIASVQIESGSAELKTTDIETPIVTGSVMGIESKSTEEIIPMAGMVETGLQGVWEQPFAQETVKMVKTPTPTESAFGFSYTAPTAETIELTVKITANKSMAAECTDIGLVPASFTVTTPFTPITLESTAGGIAQTDIVTTAGTQTIELTASKDAKIQVAKMMAEETVKIQAEQSAVFRVDETASAPSEEETKAAMVQAEISGTADVQTQHWELQAAA